MCEYRFTIGEVSEVAERSVGIDGWKACTWEDATNGSIITGCVPDGVYSKGPRKGLPRFDKPVQGTKRTVVVSEHQMRITAEKYESETNKCWDCKGTGQVFAGWHCERGFSYRVCNRCDGGGTPLREVKNGGPSKVDRKDV